MNILILKLVNGETIIGEVESLAREILVHNAVKLIDQKDAEGSSTLMLEPVNINGIENTISLKRNHIIYTAEVNEEMLRFYETTLDYIEEFFVPSRNKELINITKNLKEALNSTDNVFIKRQVKLEDVFPLTSNTIH